MRVPGVGVRDVLQEEFVDFGGFGSNDALSAFLEDRFSLGSNVMFTVGLRWEQQTLGSGRGVLVADGYADDGSISARAQHNFRFDDNWAPRLNLVWDPTGHAKAKLFASAGRFFESIPVDINVRALNGVASTWRWFYSDVTHDSTNWYNPNGSPINGDWTEYDVSLASNPPRPHPIDPTTRLQFQDEYSVGAEMQAGAVWRLGARFVDRQIGRVIEDQFSIDPRSPRRRGELIITNPGEGRYDAGLGRPSRHYQALELTAQRRLTRGWQLISSLVTAREHGNDDGLYSYSNQFDTPNSTPDLQLARFDVNSFGRLHGDIPYQFKLHSSWDLPLNFTVAEGFTYSAGTPISRLAAPAFTFGSRNLYFTPRGSEGRTPDFWTVDLHASWRLPLWGSSISLIADLFNATNNHEVLTVDENYIIPGMPGIGLWRASSNLDEWGLPKYDASLPHSKYYRTAASFQPARSLQIGLRMTY
jgi:hypothetical protein